MIHAADRLLSSVRLERLAEAFEVSQADVVLDAVSIVDWSGSPAELEALLNTRHAWSTDEAFYFIRQVRLAVWCTASGVPERRSSLSSGLYPHGG